MKKIMLLVVLCLLSSWWPATVQADDADAECDDHFIAVLSEAASWRFEQNVDDMLHRRGEHAVYCEPDHGENGRDFCGIVNAIDLTEPAFKTGVRHDEDHRCGWDRTGAAMFFARYVFGAKYFAALSPATGKEWLCLPVNGEDDWRHGCLTREAESLTPPDGSLRPALTVAHDVDALKRLDYAHSYVRQAFGIKDFWLATPLGVVACLNNEDGTGNCQVQTWGEPGK
ncbi:MAG: hypothetical protein HKM24_05940 [Gammaproteobacteria bacterium]|nr:hypothetical protein [Gammaproteobacteria bacterium]